MSTLKTLAERLEKAPRRSDAAEQDVTPVKSDGPRPLGAEEIHAAGLLHAAPGNGGAPQRARRMARLQQALGNARLVRLLGEVGVPKGPGEERPGPEHPEIPRRK